jgi:hypothetical protein
LNRGISRMILTIKTFSGSLDRDGRVGAHHNQIKA